MAKDKVRKEYEIPGFVDYLVKREILWDYYAERGDLLGGAMVFVAQSEGSGDDTGVMELQIMHPMARLRSMDSLSEVDEQTQRFTIKDQLSGVEPVLSEFDDLDRALRNLFDRMGKARGGAGDWARPDWVLSGLLYDFYGRD